MDVVVEGVKALEALEADLATLFDQPTRVIQFVIPGEQGLISCIVVERRSMTMIEWDGERWGIPD